MSANKPPYLMAGVLEPEVLHRFETTTKLYFCHKKTPPEEQVAAASGWIEDNLIQNWYWLLEEKFNEMKFDNFIKEIHGKWLRCGWEKKTRQKVLGAKQGSAPFWEWALHIRQLNALLVGSP
jgi:hypothetical protein